jgi:N-acetylglucosamine kinase-like BadF-type ATPase
MLLPEAKGRWLLGVDGGGTKTSFILADADGRIVATHRGSTSYHVGIGVDAVIAVLAEGMAAVSGQAGIILNEIGAAFFGLPAFGEDDEADRRLSAAIGVLLGHENYVCDNDMVCGWAGSLGGADGINIVGGTGSIAYGRRGDQAARCGGWGEAFGDEGSAYWIAVEGLRVFTQMSDGRLPKSPLYDIVRAQLALTDDLQLLPRFLLGAEARQAIAGFAPVVMTAAEADPAAAAILDRAARELARHLVALRARLGYGAQDVAVSYSGGLFSQGSGMVGRLQNALARGSGGWSLREPLAEPDIGAVIMASRLR